VGRFPTGEPKLDDKAALRPIIRAARLLLILAITPTTKGKSNADIADPEPIKAVVDEAGLGSLAIFMTPETPREP
jgi:hypothetical protein